MAKPRVKPASFYKRNRRRRRFAEWRDLVRNRWSFWVVVLGILLSISTYAVLRVSKPVVLRDGSGATAQLPPLLDLDDLVFDLGAHFPRPYLDLLGGEASVPPLSDLQLAFEPVTLQAGLAPAQSPLPEVLGDSAVRFPEPNGERLLAAGFADSARPQDFTLSQQMQDNPLKTAYFAGLQGRPHTKSDPPPDVSSQKEPCEGGAEDCEEEDGDNRARPMNDRDSIRPPQKENAVAVPEPGSLMLLLSGLAALGVWKAGRNGRSE